MTFTSLCGIAETPLLEKLKTIPMLADMGACTLCKKTAMPYSSGSPEAAPKRMKEALYMILLNFDSRVEVLHLVARVSKFRMVFISVSIVSLLEAGAIGRAAMLSSFGVEVIPRLLTGFKRFGFIRNTYIINHAALRLLLAVGDRKGGPLVAFLCGQAVLEPLRVHLSGRKQCTCSIKPREKS